MCFFSLWCISVLYTEVRTISDNVYNARVVRICISTNMHIILCAYIVLRGQRRRRLDQAPHRPGQGIHPIMRG